MFAEAARHGSFVRSARAMNVTQAAVSKQVAGLEDQLGVKLFDRGYRGIQLTDAGRRYQSVAERIIDLMERASDGLAGDEPRPTLRLEVDFEFYVYFVLPRLRSMLAALPGTVVEITPRHAMPARPSPRTNVAISYGRLDEQGLESEKLIDFEVFAVGAPALLRGRGDPLATLPLFHDVDTSWWDEILGHEGVARDDPPIVLGQPMFCLEAATAGLGLAVGNDFLCARALTDGRLVEVGDHRLPARDAYWLAVDDAHEDRTAVDRFTAWLHEELRSV